MKPFEFKREQEIVTSHKSDGRTISEFSYDFILQDNPRGPNGELGTRKCHLCGCSTSVLLSMWVEHAETSVVMCGGCLDKMQRLIHWRILEQAKEGRQDA